jgi:hypothetical protein
MKIGGSVEAFVSSDPKICLPQSKTLPAIAAGATKKKVVCVCSVAKRSSCKIEHRNGDRLTRNRRKYRV